MASDLQFTEGNMKWKGITKIFKFPAHPNTFGECAFIGGFAGTASSLVAVAEFFSLPETTKPPKIKDLRGLILTEKGDIFAFDDYGMWLRMDQPYAAIGSGAAFALGAMANGATPKEAVRIAMKHDAFTGMGVKSLRW